jgi:hypothetical protein
MEIISLKLNIYGKVYCFLVPLRFEIDRLKEYFTLGNVKFSSECIYANVITLEKPLSIFLKELSEVKLD